MRGRTITTSLIAGLMVLLSLAPLTAATAPAAAGKPLDLAAMALRPDDLPQSGYGIWDGQTFTVDVAARLLAANGQGNDATTIGGQLRDAGWVAGQEVTLGLPDASNPAQPASLVESQIVEFASPAGATKGFTVLNNQAGISGVTQHAPASAVGDQSVITIDRRQAQDATLPGVSVDLAFRHGALVGDVAVMTYGADAKPASDSALIHLAGTLLHRMELVEQGHDVPGLSPWALHLSGASIVTYYDNYERIDNTTIPYASEDTQATAARDQFYTGLKVTDTYAVMQTSGDIGNPGYGLYSLTVDHFARQKNAESWVRGLTVNSVTTIGQLTSVAVVKDAPSFGDESATFSYRYERPDKTEAAGYVVYLRTGRTGAVVQIDGVPGISLATAGKVAAAQAACQKAGDCRHPLASPFTTSAATATPAATPTIPATPPAASTPGAGPLASGTPVAFDANGAWSEPAAILPPKAGSSNAIQELPSIVGRADGTLIAVWLSEATEVDQSGNEPLMWSSLAPGAGAWTTPARVNKAAFAVSGHTATNALHPQLVALPDGSLVLVWRQLAPGESRLRISTLALGAHAWSTPERLPGSNETGGAPSLTVGSDGELYAVWAQSTNGYTRPVFNTRAADGTWGKASVVRSLPHHTVTMADGHDLETGGFYPRVAVGPDGRVVVVWMDDEGTVDPSGDFRLRLLYSVLDRKTGKWGKNLPVEPGDPTNLNGNPIAMAANADGIVVAAIDASGALAWTMLPAGKSAWTKPARIEDATRHPDTPRLLVGPTGELVATWRTDSSIHAAFLAPGSTGWVQAPAAFKGVGFFDFDAAIMPDGQLAVAAMLDMSGASSNLGIPVAVSVYTPGGPGSTKVEATPNPRPDVTEPAAKPVFRGNDAHTGVQPGPAPAKLKPLWSWAPGDHGLPLPGSGMAPATLVDGVVYVSVTNEQGSGGPRHGLVAAVDATSGKTIWTHGMDGGAGDIAVSDGMAYVVGKDAIVALDAKTGKQVWAKGPAPAASIPTVVNKVIYFSLAGTGENGTVVAMDAKTGKQIWQVTVDAFLSGGPTMVDGVLYLAGESNTGPNGTFPGVAYALDAKSGKTLWHTALPTLPNQDSENVSNEPAVYGGMVYLSTQHGQVFALDASTGKIVWKQQGCITSIIVTDGVVYCGGELFHAFDSLTGTPLWDLEVGGVGSSPVLADGKIYFLVAGPTGALQVLDVATRTLTTIPGVIADTNDADVSPLVVDGALFINDVVSGDKGTGQLVALGDR